MRYDAFQPVRLPAAVWSSQETWNMLRERRVGQLFLLAKKHAGASQARIAAATGLNQGEVSRIQRGNRWVTAIDVLERVADGLAMPDFARMALGLAPACWTNSENPVLAADVRWPASQPQVVPAQLPPTVSGFTGRSAELDWLCEHAAGGRAIVTGPRGSGKTALALTWAHTVAREFPDGQLYVDLRGSGPDPLQPSVALAGFLRALDRADVLTPPTVEECTGRYRSLLAGRRVLVLVDDAASAAQVRPLLPGDPCSLLVTTSRTRLDDLVIHEGMPMLRLSALLIEEAVELLAEIVGRTRVEAEPAAVAELAHRCGGNPLALRVAAANLTDCPTRPVSAIAAELAVSTRRRQPRVA